MVMEGEHKGACSPNRVAQSTQTSSSVSLPLLLRLSSTHITHLVVSLGVNGS